MVVVAIIGVISVMAYPQFTTFMAKAKQAEGKNSMYMIRDLQIAFNAENGHYGNFEDIGFSVSGVTFACSNTGASLRRKECQTTSSNGNARYTYGIYTFATNGVERYWAHAQAPRAVINPSSSCRRDYWQIGEMLTHPTNWHPRSNCVTD